jgi:hypothetical protein
MKQTAQPPVGPREAELAYASANSSSSINHLSTESERLWIALVIDVLVAQIIGRSNHEKQGEG